MNCVIEKTTFTKRFSSLHTHKSYEIIVVEKGRAVISSDKEKKEVKEGEVLIIPPTLSHNFISGDEDFTYYYIYGIENPYLSCSGLTVLNPIEREEVLTLMRIIYLNRYSTNEDYRDSLIASFVLLLSHNIHYDDVITSAVHAVAVEITRNFKNPKLNPCSLLVKSGYAEDYIRAKFKEITGKKPNEFLTETRINHAKKMIDAFKGTVPLCEIATLCGYDDYPYFSRKFRLVTGYSPREYLKLKENQEN